ESRCHPVPQHVRRVALAQTLERAIAQLPDALPRDAELASDLLQRHRAAALQPEIEREHATITRRQNLERASDRLPSRVALDPARQNIFVFPAVEDQRLAQGAPLVA